MSGVVSEHVRCAICIETLRPPIRMLGCGHNFCHICVVGLCAAYEEKRCPTCRQSIKLKEENVASLPRNHTLENLLQMLEVYMPIEKATAFHPVLAGDAIKQLKDLGALFQRQQHYKEAADILQVVIGQSEGWGKLNACVSQANCFLDLGRVKEARLVCCQLISVVGSSRYFPSSNETLDICDNINSLALKFISNKDFETAIFLARCRYLVIKHLRDDKKKLIKLEDVGWLMTQICQEMLEKDKTKHRQQQYSLMEEIIDIMQKSSFPDVKVKCRQVAWFLGRFAFCCNQMEDWEKSISLNEKAITLMKTAYGADSSQYRVFGSCHYNLGVALQNVGLLHRARDIYTDATDIYYEACDWPDETRKLNTISNVTKCLKHLNEKIRKLES